MLKKYYSPPVQMPDGYFLSLTVLASKISKPIDEVISVVDKLIEEKILIGPRGKNFLFLCDINEVFFEAEYFCNYSADMIVEKLQEIDKEVSHA